MHVQLQAKELSIGYSGGENQQVLAKDLALSLVGGEIVCLLGPNGAGKSTLIRTLAGMQPPLAGSIEFAGQPLAQVVPRERAKAVSVVLTGTTPPGMMDVYSLVSLGRHPYSGWFGGLNAEDRQRITEALAAVGASDHALRQVSELSDGERQKIFIARALAQEAKLMLLDEPTAFLDLPRRVELMSLLRELAHRKGLAMLLSTHDLDLALRFADRIWLIDPSGKLMQGPPEALALNGEFAKVFSSENLNWDASSGSFRSQSVACLTAQLSGTGLERIWTQRALERLGFGLTEDSTESQFSVKVTGGEWRVVYPGGQNEFNEIEAFIQWTRGTDWRR